MKKLLLKDRRQDKGQLHPSASGLPHEGRQPHHAIHTPGPLRALAPLQSSVVRADPGLGAARKAHRRRHFRKSSHGHHHRSLFYQTKYFLFEKSNND